MADEASIDEIDTRCPEIKKKEEEAMLLRKRPAQVLCTCFRKPCLPDLTSTHRSTCNWKWKEKQPQQKSPQSRKRDKKKQRKEGD
jgi:hypothetical protein